MRSGLITRLRPGGYWSGWTQIDGRVSSISAETNADGRGRGPPPPRDLATPKVGRQDGGMSRHLLLLACAALLFTSSSPAAPLTQAAHREGTIVFIRFTEEIAHSRLTLLPMVGGRAQEVRSPFLAVDGPAWSSDGNSLVFVGGRNQADQPRVTEGDDLYLLTLATHRIQRLTDDAAHESGATFASVGSRFAFVRSPSDAPNRSSIFVSSLRGDHSRRLTFGNVDLEPSWNSAGTWIAFLRINPAQHTSGIWEVRPNGQGLRQILSRMTNVTDPVWAPRGNRLLVSDGQRLWLVRPDGSGRHVVAKLAADPSGARIDPEPAFSPDGSSIVFVQARATAEGHADLWRVSTTGGRPMPLTHSPGLDLSPAWG
jgi:Tol biopolymer transport system component